MSDARGDGGGGGAAAPPPAEPGGRWARGAAIRDGVAPRGSADVADDANNAASVSGRADAGSIHAHEGETLREKALAQRAARQRALVEERLRKGGVETRGDGGADGDGASGGTVAEEGARVENEIHTQRESRRPNRRADNTEREISEKLDKRVNVKFEDDDDDDDGGGGGEKKPRGAGWGKAKRALEARRMAVHLSNVHNDNWTDANALFEYYNSTYFESKLSENVTFGWISRDEHEGNEFRYCLCSAVPGWWHGEHKNLMCGVACDVERRRGAAERRSVHIRMPEAMRKFKLTNMTKEGLLHSMIHAWLFVTAQIADHEPFYEHGENFRRKMHSINNDTLTFDAFRPTGGYDISFSNVGDVEFGHLLTQEMMDALTVEHYKVLYLVSKYSRYAERPTEKELWVRFQPLLVLMYELIVAGVFDFDYAPASAMVAGSRVYLNTTQEGRDNLDDLVEAKLVRAMRSIAHDKQPVVAYQITEAGMASLRESPLTSAERDEIDDVIYDPTGSLLMVSWEDDAFKLKSALGYCVDSGITETEDVSYVSSPYLPYTLRDLSKPLASNAHRAGEAALGGSNVLDELDVQVTLSRLVVLVGEWIPFGCNQIMQLTQKLGAAERIKGGYFSSVIDAHSTETTLEVPVGLTKVNVNSFDAAQWINIEAEVEFPEDEGIVQVENFGIRYQRDGVTLYGLKVEAIMDSVLNDLSLDNLARVMTDIHQDSSKVTESLTSKHQQNMLRMVFNGNQENRNKVNVFIAEKITPKLRALRYLDGDALEAELKQVIGDTQHAFDITENDVVIFGDAGVLFAGPDCIRHETLLLAYLALKSREDFVMNFFNRLFIMADQLKTQQEMIDKYHEDPTHVATIRNNLGVINEDCIMLEEVMRSLASSVEKDALAPENVPTTKAGKRLYHIMQIPQMERNLRGRVQDCDKQVAAIRNEIGFLDGQITNVARALQRKVNLDTKQLYVECASAIKKTNPISARDAMTALACGWLAFKILDRTTGEWTVIWQSWLKYDVTYPLILHPDAPWFWINMTAFFILAVATYAFVYLKTEQAAGTVHFHATFDAKIRVAKLYAYLRERGLQTETITSEADGDAVMTEFSYVDEMGARLWEHYVPRIVMMVDVKNGVLRWADITIAKPASAAARIFPRELRSVLAADLDRNDVLVDVDGGKRIPRQTNAITLLAREEGRGHDREVSLEERTVLRLREQLALKFCYKVENLVRVETRRVVDGRDAEEPIVDDAQVVALRHYERLAVTFRGKPDPGMSLYAAQLKHVQSAQASGRKVHLHEMKRKGDGVAYLKYGDDVEEEDLLYDSRV